MQATIARLIHQAITLPFVQTALSTTSPYLQWRPILGQNALDHLKSFLHVSHQHSATSSSSSTNALSLVTAQHIDVIIMIFALFISYLLARAFVNSCCRFPIYINTRKYGWRQSVIQLPSYKQTFPPPQRTLVRCPSTTNTVALYLWDCIFPQVPPSLLTRSASVENASSTSTSTPTSSSSSSSSDTSTLVPALPPPRPSGVVLFISSIGMHGDMYSPMLSSICSDNVIVYAMDVANMGRSISFPLINEEKTYINHLKRSNNSTPSSDVNTKVPVINPSTLNSKHTSLCPEVTKEVPSLSPSFEVDTPDRNISDVIETLLYIRSIVDDAFPPKHKIGPIPLYLAGESTGASLALLAAIRAQNLNCLGVGEVRLLDGLKNSTASSATAQSSSSSSVSSSSTTTLTDSTVSYYPAYPIPSMQSLTPNNTPYRVYSATTPSPSLSSSFSTSSSSSSSSSSIPSPQSSIDSLNTEASPSSSNPSVLLPTSSSSSAVSSTMSTPPPLLSGLLLCSPVLRFYRFDRFFLNTLLTFTTLPLISVPLRLLFTILNTRFTLSGNPDKRFSNLCVTSVVTDDPLCTTMVPPSSPIQLTPTTLRLPYYNPYTNYSNSTDPSLPQRRPLLPQPGDLMTSATSRVYRGLSLSSLRNLIALVDTANLHGPSLLLPFQFQHGLKDLICDPHATQELKDKLAKKGDCPIGQSCLHGIEICWHGLGLEPEWRDIGENMADWILEEARHQLLSDLD